MMLKDGNYQVCLPLRVFVCEAQVKSVNKSTPGIFLIFCSGNSSLWEVGPIKVQSGSRSGSGVASEDTIHPTAKGPGKKRRQKKGQLTWELLLLRGK